MPGNPRTALESMQGRRFLLGAWPWRALGYLLASPPLMCSAAVVIGALTLPWLVTLSRVVHGAHVSPGGVLASVLGGAVLFAAGAPLLAVPLAVVERRGPALVDTRPRSSGHRPLLRSALRIGPPSSSMSPRVRSLAVGVDPLPGGGDLA